MSGYIEAAHDSHLFVTSLPPSSPQGHKVVRGRWAPPPTEGKGPREGQRYVARGQWAPPAADSNTTGRLARPPPVMRRNSHLSALVGVRQ